MKDQWGYAELVVHSPPLNIFTVFLIPFVVRKSEMKKMSEVFSKFMFWFENVAYIILILCYEMIMMPIIFFQILWNIVRHASF